MSFHTQISEYVMTSDKNSPAVLLKTSEGAVLSEIIVGESPVEVLSKVRVPVVVS